MILISLIIKSPRIRELYKMSRYSLFAFSKGQYQIIVNGIWKVYTEMGL